MMGAQIVRGILFVNMLKNQIDLLPDTSKTGAYRLPEIWG